MVSGSASDPLDINTTAHGHPNHLAPLPYLPDGFAYEDGTTDGQGAGGHGEMGDSLFDAYEEMLLGTGGGGSDPQGGTGYLRHQPHHQPHHAQPTNDAYYLELLRMAPHLAGSGSMAGAPNAQQMAIAARLNEFMGRMREGAGVEVDGAPGLKEGLDANSGSGHAGESVTDSMLC
jgi:hypothetical protein